MAQNGLSEFLQLVKKSHIARTNRFNFNITLPDKLISVLGNDTDAIKMTKQITLTCLLTDIPGYQEQTTNASYGGYSRKVAYSRSLNDFSTSFLVLGNFTEKKLFDAWSNLIMAESNNIAGYYDDYITDISIDALNNKDEIIYSIQLLEAYPTIVSSLRLNRADQNQQMILDVNWSYHRAVYSNISVIANPSNASPQASAAGASLSGKKRLLEVPGLSSLSSGLQAATSTIKEFKGQVDGILKITKDVREQVRDVKMQVLDGVKVLNGVVKDIREIRNVPDQFKRELTAVVNDTKNQLGSLKGDIKLIGKRLPGR